jgi:subtilisin-like proprotein convertase family protein
VADPGETIHITVPLQNNDVLAATNINGTLSSSTQGVTVVVAESPYPTIQSGSQSENTNSYLVNIPTTHACGADLSFSMDTNYTLGATQTNNLFNFTVPVGTPTAKSETNSNQQAIPDISSLTSQITLSGLGTVSRPAINIDIDITHTFSGDIDIKLTSPQGTTVQLKQSNLNENSANLKGNYPSDFAPLQDLSTFNGENLDGVWTLTVSDAFADDTGTLNSWSLNYDSFNCEVFTNPDTDNDGVTDNSDNCPLHSNPRQGNICTPYQLENNKWYQISLPAEGNNATVTDIFADDLPSSEYNEKWALYSYDGNAYSKLELADFIEQGKGYWIIQITGSAVDIDLPVNVLETSAQQSSQCTSTSGCYEVILQAEANNGQWSMIGYPFDNSLNSTEDIRVVTNSGVCGDTDGCTLDEAFTAKVFLNNLWSYNGEAYVDLLTTSNISSWTGMWGRTLENSNGLEVRILFPLL